MNTGQTGEILRRRPEETGPTFFVEPTDRVNLYDTKIKMDKTLRISVCNLVSRKKGFSEYMNVEASTQGRGASTCLTQLKYVS